MKRISFFAVYFTIALLCVQSTSFADVFADSDGDGGNIPDNLASGVDSVIQISQNEIIQDASFSVEGLSHSWIGDLIITVSHSTSGKSATLVHRVGTTSNPDSRGDSSDVNGTYTFNDGNPSIWTEAGSGDTDFIVPAGTYDASGVNEAVVNLNDIFGGETTQGTWTFNISDNGDTQSGSFVQTSVSFVSAVPEPGTCGVVLLSALVTLVPRRKRSM